MAYRARINMNDPRLQTSLRTAYKGNSAVKAGSKEVRGLYSSFGGQEGNRLGKTELAGKRLKDQQGIFDKEMALKKRTAAFDNAMNYKNYKLDKDTFKDAKLGSWLGLGINALSTGGTMWGSYQDRLGREQTQQQQNAMRSEWVKNNPLAAYKYEATYPGLFGLQSFLTPAVLEKARTARARQYATSTR